MKGVIQQLNTLVEGHDGSEEATEKLLKLIELIQKTNQSFRDGTEQLAVGVLPTDIFDFDEIPKTGILKRVCAKGLTSIVNALLKLGVSVSQAKREAVESGHVECIKLLVGHDRSSLEDGLPLALLYTPAEQLWAVFKYFVMEYGNTMKWETLGKNDFDFGNLFRAAEAANEADAANEIDVVVSMLLKTQPPVEVLTQALYSLIATVSDEQLLRENISELITAGADTKREYTICISEGSRVTGSLGVVAVHHQNPMAIRILCQEFGFTPDERVRVVESDGISLKSLVEYAIDKYSLTRAEDLSPMVALLESGAYPNPYRLSGRPLLLSFLYPGKINNPPGVLKKPTQLLLQYGARLENNNFFMRGSHASPQWDPSFEEKIDTLPDSRRAQLKSLYTRFSRPPVVKSFMQIYIGIMQCLFTNIDKRYEELVVFYFSVYKKDIKYEKISHFLYGNSDSACLIHFADNIYNREKVYRVLINDFYELLQTLREALNHPSSTSLQQLLAHHIRSSDVFRKGNSDYGFYIRLIKALEELTERELEMRVKQFDDYLGKAHGVCAPEQACLYHLKEYLPKLEAQLEIRSDDGIELVDIKKPIPQC